MEGMPGANFSEWYQELRRRRVFRTLIAWALASFAVLQVIEPVIHAYHLPEWTLTVVVSLLGLGFPVAAVLAWVFDLTSRGITRTQPLRPADEPGAAPVAQVVVRRRTIAMLTVLVVVAVAGTGWLFHRQSRARWAIEEVLPQVVKSTFERGDALTTDHPAPTAFYRDHVLQWSRDLGRSLDWVETRSDLDASHIAFYGLSWGAELGPLLAAVEDRIKTGVLVGGGLGLQQCPPEADPFNFAPHLKRPVLMVNGRHDFFFPYDTTQAPLFKLLGATADQKRHVVFETGHVPPANLMAREVLDWLDRYLGPVR